MKRDYWIELLNALGVIANVVTLISAVVSLWRKSAALRLRIIEDLRRMIAAHRRYPILRRTETGWVWFPRLDTVSAGTAAPPSGLVTRPWTLSAMICYVTLAAIFFVEAMLCGDALHRKATTAAQVSGTVFLLALTLWLSDFFRVEARLEQEKDMPPIGGARAAAKTVG